MDSAKRTVRDVRVNLKNNHLALGSSLFLEFFAAIIHITKKYKEKPKIIDRMKNSNPFLAIASKRSIENEFPIKLYMSNHSLNKTGI